MVTGSIIWPMVPSPRIMVGMRYLSASVEGLHGQIHHLLHGSGGKDEHAVVAVPAAAGGLIVVRLGGLDAAKARAAAHGC